MADPVRGTIVINEILAQPVAGASGYDTDGNGTISPTDEYLELYNSGASPVDLAGLQLWDPGVGNWFTFPAGSVLGPGAFALVVTGVQAGGTLPVPGPGGLAFNAGRSGSVMNNAGDNVVLYDPSGNTFAVSAYGNWPVLDPTDPASLATAPGPTSGFAGFPATATQIGTGEHFGPTIAGQSIQRFPAGSDDFRNDLPESPGGPAVCFAAGTLISTPSGARAVESLAPGDQVLAADGRVLVLRHAMQRRVSVAEQMRDARLRPVRIAAGALGQGLPARDLLVSRQHRMLIRSAMAERMFGEAEVLVAAIRLVGLPGIAVVAAPVGVSYVHLAFDRHEIILAENAPSESLLFGPQALQALPREALDELRLLFGPLAEGVRQLPARVIPSAAGQKRLVRDLMVTRGMPLDSL